MNIQFLNIQNIYAHWTKLQLVIHIHEQFLSIVMTYQLITNPSKQYQQYHTHVLWWPKI